MKTKKIYRENPYLTTIEAKVAHIDGCLVIFDQTIFFPEGGGQSCDTGWIECHDHRYPVIDVQEEDGIIYHRLGSEDIIKTHPFSIGDPVIMEIFWDRRFDNMQRHCGEHILSGAFHRLYGGLNRGFHMGEDYITIDISFDYDDDNIGSLPISGAQNKTPLTWEMAMAAEDEANRVIQANMPVRMDIFDDKTDIDGMPLRKPLALDEDISIVTIGEGKDPTGIADCVACCGTHPSSTGQIGLIKIYKIEPSKGMSRIYFEAGSRAVGNYRKQFDSLYDLGNRLSSGIDELPEKFAKYEEKNKDRTERLHKLAARVAEAESKEIARELSKGGAEIIIRKYPDLSSDDILAIGKKLLSAPSKVTGEDEVLSGLYVLVHEGSCTAFLFSTGAGPDCNEIIKTKAASRGGKGGGKKESARVFFSDHGALESFLSAVMTLPSELPFES